MGTPPTDPLGVVTIPPDEPIHIAQWGVLSGADGTLGTDSKYGVEIAIADRGGKLLGHEIRLTTEDGAVHSGGRRHRRPRSSRPTAPSSASSAPRAPTRPSAASRPSPMPA